MSEEREIQKEIEDSLKVCHEIQAFLRREKKEHENGFQRMNPGTRSEIEQILKNLTSPAAEENRQPEEILPDDKRTEERPVPKEEKLPEEAVIFHSEEVLILEDAVPQETVETPRKKKMPPKKAVPAETVSSVKVTPKPEKDVSGVETVKPWKPVTITELEPDSEADTKTQEDSQSFALFKETEEVGEEYNDTHPFLRAALRILTCIMLALLLAVFITKFVAHHTSVEGSSMETTLANGNQLIVENVSYYFHDPERFDVIVFPYNEDVNYIKRVIGLPGERVQIRDGLIYINGELLEESYGREDIEDPGLAAEEMQLGPEEYFVLGDNRNASVDSRKPEVGTVKRGDIRGKAWLCFYPLDKAAFIE